MSAEPPAQLGFGGFGAGGAITWQGPSPAAGTRTVATSCCFSQSQQARWPSGGAVAAARRRLSGEKARDTACPAGSSSAASTFRSRARSAVSSRTASTGRSPAASDTARYRRSGLTASACTPRLFSVPAGSTHGSGAGPGTGVRAGTGVGATWDKVVPLVLEVQPQAARPRGVQHHLLLQEADTAGHPRAAAEHGHGQHVRPRHAAAAVAVALVTAAPRAGSGGARGRKRRRGSDGGGGGAARLLLGLRLGLGGFLALGLGGEPVAAVARPVGKGPPVPAARTDRPLPQLQAAFARGELKPGLNVVLEERPKRRNDTVSGECGALENSGPGPRPQRRVRGAGGRRGRGVGAGRALVFRTAGVSPRPPRCDRDTGPGQPCAPGRAEPSCAPFTGRPEAVPGRVQAAAHVGGKAGRDPGPGHRPRFSKRFYV